MLAQWIVGLLALVVATPVAVASYLSASRVATVERRPRRVAYASLRAQAPRVVHAAHQRHRYHHHDIAA
jgi:hypothetical protein